MVQKVSNCLQNYSNVATKRGHGVLAPGGSGGRMEEGEDTCLPKPWSNQTDWKAFWEILWSWGLLSLGR